jgi:hypothetical protein
MSLHLSDIENKIDKRTIDDGTREVINILLAAINDWPESILTLEEYESHLSRFINSEVTREQLASSLTKIDLNIDAWRAESITQILEVFKSFKEGLTLKDIITLVKNKIE